MRKLALLLLMFSLGCASRNDSQMSELPYFEGEDLTPIWVSAADIATQGLRRVAQPSFKDQDGRIVDGSTVVGKPYIASFFFVECTNVCPTLRSSLTHVQEAFDAQEVKILSHSVMPMKDTVAKLAVYSEVNQIDSEQWKLLTGDPNQVMRLATDGFGIQLAKQNGVAGESTVYLHTETVFLVDEEGYLRGMYNGTLLTDIMQLVSDIETLLEERV